MRLVLTTPPAAEPLDVDDEKLHARVDIDDDDDLIEVYIKTAREFVEKYIQSSLITQTWTLFYDSCDQPFCKRVIDLPQKPIASITSVKTYDATNVATTFSSSSYRLSGNRIVLNDAYDWPYNYRLYDAVEIVMVAGYGAAGSAIPEDIKQAMRMLVAHYYETREAVYDAMENAPQGATAPFAVTALLQPYRKFTLI